MQGLYQRIKKEGKNMEQRKEFNCRVNDLLALYHIQDDFENFNEQLKELAKNNKMADIIHYLIKASMGMFSLTKRKITRFYRENQTVMDKINKHSDIFIFLSSNYESNGTAKEGILGYYHYLLAHKDQQDNILALLEKLKDLEIKDIKLIEGKDFKNEEYSISSNSFCSPPRFSFLENMKIIPEYPSSTMKYKTTGSNYKLMIGSSLSYSSTPLIPGMNHIEVSNLTFNPQSLPNKITKESTYDKIIQLSKGTNIQQELREVVNLSISIHDLEEQAKSTATTFGKVDGMNESPDFLEALTQIRSGISKLYALEESHEQALTTENPELTRQLIQEEQKKHLKRRELSTLDID